MNVLSLFDGISCGQIALNRVNIKYENYYASEIDKNAIKVTQNNYPNTIQLGSILNITNKDLPKIDLLIGGSPCQNFSFAGNMKGMSTKSNYEVTNLDEYLRLKNEKFEFNGQSYLFWEYVRLLKELNPKYFLLENVKMLKKWENIITETLGVKPIEINSNLVSAQNRRRLYWTNIPNITQPSDKGIKLKDIIEESFLPKLSIEEKISNLKSSYNGSLEQRDLNITFDAFNGKKVHVNLLIEPPVSFYETRTNEGKEMRRKIRIDTGLDSTPRSKKYKMYAPLNNNKGNCLVTVESPLDYIIDNNWKYRKLNIVEMERLQTLPDNYTNIVTSNQARKMIGNGWTVDVISHIFSHMV